MKELLIPFTLVLALPLITCRGEVTLPTSPSSSRIAASEDRTLPARRRAVGPGPSAAELLPCSNPALLLHHPNFVGQYMVAFNDKITTGQECSAAVDRLSKKDGFTPRYSWCGERPVYGFVSTFSRDALAKVRCEPEIDFIEEDFWFQAP